MAVPSSGPATFWSLMDDADRLALRRMALHCSVAADRPLVRQGEDSDHLLVVLKGCVKVIAHSPTGYRALLALRGPGELLGEQAGLENRVRSATLQTATPVEALVLQAARFKELSRGRPGIGRALEHTLSRRLRESDQRSVTAVEPVPVRLAALLLSLGAGYGEPGTGGGVRIGIALSQDDLAGLVMTSRRTVSRVLEQWRSRGWIATGRQALVLKAVDQLKLVASDSPGTG